MQLVLIAGSNGAGKTTLFRDQFPHHARVDADQLSRSLAPDAVATSVIEAGREALRITHDLIDRDRPIVLETTFAGAQPIRLVRSAKAAGYSTAMIYICLDTEDRYVSRVAARVALGGHAIPEETTRRRVDRSADRLAANWRLFDTGLVIDNTFEPVEIASWYKESLRVTGDHPICDRLRGS